MAVIMRKVFTAVRGAFVQNLGDGQGRLSRRLIILIGVAAVLGVISLGIYIKRHQPPAAGAYQDRVMVFRCVTCGKIEHYTLVLQRYKGLTVPRNAFSNKQLQFTTNHTKRQLATIGSFM